MKTESKLAAKNILCTLIYYTGALSHMRTPQSKIGALQKVGECLYRCSSNGVYYARIRVDGKEIKRSLGTTDRPIANRDLRHFKDEQREVDRSKGKITLSELCDQCLATVQHQKPKTVDRKTLIVRRIKSDWPTGSLTQVAKIKPTDVRLWSSRYAFGPVSRNHHLAFLKPNLARTEARAASCVGDRLFLV
jgi:hypothetical protein